MNYIINKSIAVISVIGLSLFFLQSSAEEETLKTVNTKQTENTSIYKNGEVSVAVRFFPKQDVQKHAIQLELCISNSAGSDIKITNPLDFMGIDGYPQSNHDICFEDNVRMKIDVRDGKLPDRPYTLSYYRIKKDASTKDIKVEDVSEAQDWMLPAKSETQIGIVITKLVMARNFDKKYSLPKGIFDIRVLGSIIFKSGESNSELFFTSDTFNIALDDIPGKITVTEQVVLPD